MDVINRTKKLIVQTAMSNNTGHIPSSFSCLEILYTLYSRGFANINQENAKDLIRDRVILSKEHARLGHCSLLGVLGLIPIEYVPTWQQNGGQTGHDLFGCHAYPELYALDPASSSLGQGLGLALGYAIASPNNKIFCIVGDGELQEGSIWEAIMYIGHNKIKNLTLIIDRNFIQIECHTKNMIDTSSNIVNQLKEFHFDVIECDGHNIDELEKSFSATTEKPKCIVANTIKGKECQFLLDTRSHAYIHSCTYTKEEYLRIIENINRNRD